MPQNSMTDAELADLAARASTLQERLAGAVIPAGDGDTARPLGPFPERSREHKRATAGKPSHQSGSSVEEIAQADHYLSIWQEALGSEDPDCLARRLAWDGLDIDMVRPFLGAVRRHEHAVLPDWVNDLSALLEATADYCERGVGQPTDRCLDPKDPVAFEDILLPFIVAARRRLAARTGVAYELLSDVAHATLEHKLLVLLSNLCQPVFWVAFSTYRKKHQLFGHSAKESTNRTRLYQSFVTRFLTDGLRDLFLTYPVLARLVTTQIRQWVINFSSFLARVAADHGDLQQTFHHRNRLGQVIWIRTGLSDPHHGGQTVLDLKFSDGLRVIYKPRSLAAEVVFYDLLEWFNKTTDFDFKTIPIIDRTEYGWMGYVEHESCLDHAGATRYFFRTGQLLAVSYVLRSTDFHFQNLIACGEYPMLVDLEVLTSAHRQDLAAGRTEAERLAEFYLGDSVLLSGLLPFRGITLSGQTINFGGLSRRQFQSTFGVVCREANTDAMRPAYDTQGSSAAENVPVLGNAPLSVSDFEDHVVRGFREMYRHLSDNGTLLLQPCGPLEALKRLRVRAVFRSTEVYATLLARSRHPRILRDGVAYDLHFEQLVRIFVSADTVASEFWPLLRQEKLALMEQDVPYFSVAVEDGTLYLSPEKSIVECTSPGAWDLLVDRLAAMPDDNDLIQQETIVRASLTTNAIDGPPTCPADAASDSMVDHGVVDIPSADMKACTSSCALEHGQAIARLLRGAAVHLADGSAIWFTLQYHNETKRMFLRPMGYDLYNGSIGIPLFLAALDQVAKTTAHRSLTVAALQPLRQILGDDVARSDLADSIGIGGITGIASLLQPLALLYRWLDDDALLSMAQQAATTIVPEKIATDSQFDIKSGCAGALLGLLALYRIDPDEIWLDRARQCSRRLVRHCLANSSGSGTGEHTEDDIRGRLGYAVGYSGIACALLQLYAITEEQRLFGAAQEAIEYERRAFRDIYGDSSDLRANRQLAGVTSWCHGRLGIALAQIQLLRLSETNVNNHTTSALRHITEVLDMIGRADLGSVDHLCCGNFGRIDMLLEASRLLGDHRYLDDARNIAALILARIDPHQSGGYVLFDGNCGSGFVHPGFFRGLSGIGFSLLRLAQPDLPCVWSGGG